MNEACMDWYVITLCACKYSVRANGTTATLWCRLFTLRCGSRFSSHQKTPGELAGTATGYAFVVHAALRDCVFSVLFGGLC